MGAGMSAKSWVGVVLAVVVFSLGGFYVTRPGCVITAQVGFFFGGALLFCGLLIDPAEFKSILSIWRRP